MKNSGSAKRYTTAVFISLTGFLILAFMLDLLLGSVSIPFKEALAALFGKTDPGTDLSRSLLLQFRLPKALTAVVVGMGLSVSGLLMQTVFRNPLAGPYVLGVSSGASLGVALVILGFSGWISLEVIQGLGNWVLAGAAFAGGFLTMLLILLVSIRIKDIMVVLIFGIMFGSATSAVVSILQYFSQESLLKTFVIWTMGSLGNLSVSQLKVLIILVISGILMSALSVKKLNALLLGEDYARSMGMNLLSGRIWIFLSSSILAGSITAFCGPIGFIGIAMPHLTRILLKTSRHELLIPGSLLMGALALLVSDIISQLPGSDRILPINSVTALIGIPVILWFLFRGQKSSSYFYE